MYSSRPSTGSSAPAITRGRISMARPAASSISCRSPGTRPAREWGMAPGFDRRDHDGVTRRVRHECMFCHNAYPEVGGAAVCRTGASQAFPQQLPEGIGCQRCHGPGADHVRRRHARRTCGRDPRGDREPGTARRAAAQGHLLRAATCSRPWPFRARGVSAATSSRSVPASRSPTTRAARHHEKNLPRADRFEINHHPYRLNRAAASARASGG